MGPLFSRSVGEVSPVEVEQDHPNSTLLVEEFFFSFFLLRLVEEEVEVDRLLRVLVELEEVPQQLAQLLAPLVPSPQAGSSRRSFDLHIGAAVLVALSALQADGISSLQLAVESPAPQLSVAAHSVRESLTAHQQSLGSCWQHEAADPCALMLWLSYRSQ